MTNLSLSVFIIRSGFDSTALLWPYYTHFQPLTPVKTALVVCVYTVNCFCITTSAELNVKGWEKWQGYCEGVVVGMVPGEGVSVGTVPGEGVVVGMVPGEGVSVGTVPGEGVSVGMVPGEGVVVGMVPGEGVIVGTVPGVSVKYVRLTPSATHHLRVTPEQGSISVS